MKVIDLAFHSMGTEGAVVVILHGLFGSGRNWRAVGQKLIGRYQVYLPDLRNHGRSNHSPAMDIPHLAADLLSFLDRHEIESATFIGHSLGGKVAMWLALTDPDRVEKLIAVDIAPVTYTHNFDDILEGLQCLPVDQLTSRKEADLGLAEWIAHPGLRQFLLQNLVSGDSGYRWRVDLEIISRAIPELLAFPPIDSVSVYPKQALFIKGSNSDYIQPGYAAPIKRLFPKAAIETIDNAGHWVHMDQPDRFMGLVDGFLEIR